MIHPHTEIRLTSDQFSYGTFATEFIPKGAITFVKNCLDFSISPSIFGDCCEDMQRIIADNSFVDENGNRIINADFQEAIRQSEHSNTMDTGYGFEIAIEDIHVGEQLTKAYQETSTMDYISNYYGESGPTRFERNNENWYENVLPALMAYGHLVQPLAALLSGDMLSEVDALLRKSSHLNRKVNVAAKSYEMEHQLSCY